MYLCWINRHLGQTYYSLNQDLLCEKESSTHHYFSIWFSMKHFHQNKLPRCLIYLTYFIILTNDKNILPISENQTDVISFNALEITAFGLMLFIYFLNLISLIWLLLNDIDGIAMASLPQRSITFAWFFLTYQWLN